MNTISRLPLLKVAAAVAALCVSTLAAAVGPRPAPLPQPMTLTVGYQKVGHLAPMALIVDDLKKMNVDLKLVEFVRYADARTALLSNSLDMATVGPADLAIALSQGSRNMVGIMGVGSSFKYVIGRKGVTFNSWNDIKGKKIGIAPGSAVWFQFAAALTEKGVPYNGFTEVKIQGAGANFDQALKRGDVDGIVTWEPFESVPVIEGYGYFAKSLEYSQTKSVGAELGMLAAARAAATSKKEAVQRFVWAYLNSMEQLQASPEKFAQAYAQFTGLPLATAKEAAKPIKLGGVVDLNQIKRQAKAFNDLGVIQKDVSGQIAEFWDTSFVTNAERK
ncbi:MAG TPA: ABC transporter substrate-binding protein [Burkholderiales bacterium]